MKSNILLLRTSYWTGAILDALAFMIMSFPALFAWNNGLSDFRPGVEFRYAMGMGAPLMLGWTILLVWADRKPLERRHVLWITLLVLAGEVLTEFYGLSVGFIRLQALLLTLVLQLSLSALFVLALWKASR
jgi:hypothetical protein